MAASASLLAQLEERLTCPICSELYTKPRLLPCQHLLCSACLDKLASDNLIKCPICQQTEPLTKVVPDQRMEKLKQVFELERALQGAPEACFQCEAPAADWLCVSCGRSLCQVCSKSHPKLFKGHVTRSAGEAEREARGRLEGKLAEVRGVREELARHREVCEARHQQQVKQALDKVRTRHLYTTRQ